MEGGQRVQGRTRQDDEAVEHCRVAIAEWRLASVDCSGDCRLAIVGWRLSVGDCRLAIDSEDCRVATADRIEKGLQERGASVGRISGARCPRLRTETRVPAVPAGTEPRTSRRGRRASSRAGGDRGMGARARPPLLRCESGSAIAEWRLTESGPSIRRRRASYPSRSTVAGSSRAARRAGSHPASRPAATSTPAPPASVAGS